MIDMKGKFMCISIRQDGYEVLSSGGQASYNKEGRITVGCGDIDSFPATLSISVAENKKLNTDKTLEQRVADLEKQLADTSQAAGAKIEIIETPSGNGISMIAHKSDGTIVCRIEPF
ncbi:hypothetical protein [Morganella psychrotolerans]|uniref:Uncharacterized protein n=1 Tax=Morganella psychrotolerans TaxID=368603 RepID=A0A1B8HFD2_9GAMM|nr:hypothetical protein [Morganella psychrotolerans]OBU07777.1 hypothetical protein AYY18_06030 [Morganella psychrotolerans]